MIITTAQIQAITGLKFDKAQIFTDAINDTIAIYSINTRDRFCHWFAQLCHESGGLRWFKEFASGNEYDSRTDLGNTPQIDGDGALYKGRGAIQLTGRDVYVKYYKDKGIEFKPENSTRLEEMPLAIDSAGWFWSVYKASRHLNKLADESLNGKFDTLKCKEITKIVNGGQNGIDDRLKYLRKCREVIK